MYCIFCAKIQPGIRSSSAFSTVSPLVSEAAWIHALLVVILTKGLHLPGGKVKPKMQICGFEKERAQGHSQFSATLQA